jgi:hypothetical protein
MAERLSRPALAKQLAMRRQREEAAWMEADMHEQTVQAAPAMNARSRMLAEAAGGGAALHVRAAEWAAERARRLADKRAALEWAEQQALAPAGSVNSKARRRAAEKRREKRKMAEEFEERLHAAGLAREDRRRQRVVAEEARVAAQAARTAHGAVDARAVGARFHAEAEATARRRRERVSEQCALEGMRQGETDGGLRGLT